MFAYSVVGVALFLLCRGIYIRQIVLPLFTPIYSQHWGGYGRRPTSLRPFGLCGRPCFKNLIKKDLGALGAVKLIQYVPNMHKVLASQYKIKHDGYVPCTWEVETDVQGQPPLGKFQASLCSLRFCISKQDFKCVPGINMGLQINWSKGLSQQVREM